MEMRKLSLRLSFVAMAVFAACGDDGSSAGDLSELSSSSGVDVIESCAAEESLSSSSEAVDSSVSKDSSSSSSETVVFSVSEVSSSSETTESGSDEKSSSSKEPESSSEVASSGSVWWPSSDGSIYDATANTLTDQRDNQVYRTITIAPAGSGYSEVWMAENLNFRYLGSTDELDSSSFCYNNAPASCDTYGRLYLWSATMDSVGIWSTNGKGCGRETDCTPTTPVRGVCPKGWHVPSQSEWSDLVAAVGSSSGTKLKSTSGWDDDAGGVSTSGLNEDVGRSGNGDDTFGFSVFPAGDWEHQDGYSNEGKRAFFWSSTPDGDVKAHNIDFYYDGDYAYLNDYSTTHAFSVRCLKD